MESGDVQYVPKTKNSMYCCAVLSRSSFAKLEPCQLTQLWIPMACYSRVGLLLKRRRLIYLESVRSLTTYSPLTDRSQRVEERGKEKKRNTLSL